MVQDGLLMPVTRHSRADGIAKNWKLFVICVIFFKKREGEKERERETDSTFFIFILQFVS